MTCPHCGNDPVRALYDELRNDHATATDAVFWMVIGAICLYLGQLAIGR